jgi:acetylornithine deacetylase/succinyl-diaminopimelate desuccinylase-like protein
MDQRRDAACAVAELALYMEQRARADGDSVATIGQWQVPAGSVNVVPGRCEFSLDMRAPSDAQRDALCADVLAQLDAWRADPVALWRFRRDQQANLANRRAQALPLRHWL